MSLIFILKMNDYFSSNKADVTNYMLLHMNYVELISTAVTYHSCSCFNSDIKSSNITSREQDLSFPVITQIRPLKNIYFQESDAGKLRYLRFNT